jgi:hypothetical protein
MQGSLRNQGVAAEASIGCCDFCKRHRPIVALFHGRIQKPMNLAGHSGRSRHCQIERISRKRHFTVFDAFSAAVDIGSGGWNHPSWNMASSRMGRHHRIRCSASALTGSPGDHQTHRSRGHDMVGKEVIGLALDGIRTSVTSARGCKASISTFVRRSDWRRSRVAPFKRLFLCRRTPHRRHPRT